MQPLRPRGFQVVPGQYYGSPKEIWGFRSARASGRPEQIALRFLSANRALFKLEDVLPALRLRRVIVSLGARHVIFEQRFRRLLIHRAYVTVHVSRDRRVFLVKNRAVPKEFLHAAGFRLTPRAARRRAFKAVGKHRREFRVLGSVEKLWFPRREAIRPAFRVRLHREAPRQEWLIYVDGATGGILSRYDNLAFALGRGRVFDPNPVVALGDWRPLLRDGRPIAPPEEAYETVRLGGLRATGYLDGGRVSTAPTPRRVRSTRRRFLYAARDRGFEEVMAYFHVDRAMRYLESLGYRSGRSIFSEAMKVNARGTREDNSWYSPGLRSLTFGTGGVDDAEDAETILHEFGHAVQDAICPDFGQSVQAAAMGEGFGDYFAGSFFAGMKTRAFRPALMTWDAIASGDGEPPCLRRLDEPVTFESFDGSDSADEHENGKIWSATLWAIWNALGRDVADRLIVESHFQLDGFTTFARGARAILDADRNLFAGRHVRRLRGIFAAHGIGPAR